MPPQNPVLSVVVATASDTINPPDSRHYATCLAALDRQSDAPTMEIIVPHPPAVAGIDALRRQHPGVRFLEVTNLRQYPARRYSREHHGELISRGFALARGSLVALIEDHDVVAPDWSAHMLEAHRRPLAGVGGAIENGIGRPLNWAVYFCDFLRYQTPLPEGESARASDANVTYKRAALESIRPVWQQEYHEASVNSVLIARGEKIAFAPGAVAYQHRQGLRLGVALKERFVWGRSFGAWRCGQASTARRIFWTVFAPTLPVLLVGRMTVMAAKKRRTMGAFLKALPLTAVLVAGWAAGEMVGYITGRAIAQSDRPAVALARGPAAS
jgi:hypothetical protein